MPSGGQLGIRAGEHWAYLETKDHPLVEVIVLDPGRHYDDFIRVRYANDPPDTDPAYYEIATRRWKLPCRWDDLDDYLARHPEVPRGDAQSFTTRSATPSATGSSPTPIEKP